MSTSLLSYSLPACTLSYLKTFFEVQFLALDLEILIRKIFDSYFEGGIPVVFIVDIEAFRALDVVVMIP